MNETSFAIVEYTIKRSFHNQQYIWSYVPFTIT